jgi:hypothetical protein
MCEQRIPVILCIDVEPDKPFGHRSDPMPWEGYRRAVEFFARFRPELEALTRAPVRLSWFYRMDPQIDEIHGDPGWAVKNYPDQTKALIAAGDELGLHTHPHRWDNKKNTWIQDYGNQRWVEYSLRMAFNTFSRELNRPCISFRFGDRWMNNPICRLLEALGVKYDLTLEPGSKKLPSYHPGLPYTGFIPDQRKVPRGIFRPAKSNYQKRDPSRTDGPYMIPISTAPIHLGSGAVYREPRLHERIYYRLTERERIRNWTYALNIAAETHVFRNIVDYNLQTLGLPYLAMVARAHIFTSAEFMTNARANLGALLEESPEPGDSSFQFMTPAEAVACLEGVRDN